MSLENHKLDGFSFLHKNQPDRPNMSASQFKNALDSQAEELRDKLNSLIDELQVTSGGSVEFDKREVNVLKYGAKGNGVTDDTAAIQSALNALTNDSILIIPKGTFLCSATLTLGVYKKGIKITGGGTLKFSNTGDGLNLSSVPGEYDHNHVIEGIKIVGTDPYYPPDGYIPVSTGAGINFSNCYSCLVRDVQINGFYYGVYFTSGIKNIFEGRTYIYGNQYGLYALGGEFNANSFNNVKFRENRKQGIHIAYGSVNSWKATANVFTDCLIESNKPFPYTTPSSVPNDSVGVYLSQTYDNIFENCYFENHEYALYITGSSDGNKFNNCRFEHGGKVAYFDGTFIYNTQFNNCIHNSFDFTTPSIEANNEIFNTRINNCSGFNLFPSSLPSTRLDVFNCPPDAGNSGGTVEGSLRIPYYGFAINPVEGTTRGRIQGIGTDTAVLYAQGCGEVSLGTIVAGVATDTTITAFNGLQRGQFLAIYNHQNTRRVTIKSEGHTPTSTITLLNDADCILQNYGDMILFWVNYLGRAVEVMRNVSMTGNAWVDPPSILTGTQITQAITVNGAAIGDLVMMGATLNLSGLMLTGYVSAANTVTAVLFNATGAAVDLGTVNLRARVVKNGV